MYFDHVRCPSCGASFDPERVDARHGVMACPACGAQLDLKSLFGLGAHLEEPDQEHVTLDDLVSGGPSTASAPAPRSAPAPGSAPPPSEPARGPIRAIDVLRESKKRR